jgi:succinate dehydrogenase/fumarate reductase flavoprotein subunit
MGRDQGRTAGARVTLVDKGYCGASGATASAGTGIWYVDDVPELREQAMVSREALGGYLADRDWMARVLDETHARMDELATVQRYPFPVGQDGRPRRGDLQGPEYMRRQRLRAQRVGARILDHTTALELLVDGDQVVAGAHVLDSQDAHDLPLPGEKTAPTCPPFSTVADGGETW